MKHEQVIEGERRDKSHSFSAMISEDRSAPSNLPQQVKMTMYPSNGRGMRESINDKITGIDEECRNMDSKMNSNRSKSKW